MDRDKIYVDTRLWLPKELVNTAVIKRVLTLDDTPMWEETASHIGLPRHYLQPDELPQAEIVDLRPKTHQKVLSSLVTLDAKNPTKTIQREAAAALLAADGGVLHIRCGAGKTPTMLHVAATRGGPTLIIVHRSTLMEQWAGEVKGTATKKAKVTFSGELGFIKGPPKRWKWQHPVVIASLQTLLRHRSSVTKEMQEWFETIIWDECHHISAKLFILSASMFPGTRYGCTATARRQDGTEHVFFSHLGPIRYEYLEQDIKPEVHFIRQDVNIDLEDPAVRRRVCVAKGEIHHTALANELYTHANERALIQELVQFCQEHERNVLFISRSKEKVKQLHRQYPGSAALHEEVPASTRLQNFLDARLSFGTFDMAVEALDKGALDTLVFLEETGNTNIMAQAVGRTQRGESDNTPLIFVIWHQTPHALRQRGVDMMRWVKKQAYPYVTHDSVATCLSS
jgi:superfamily II DNA or RNA helicase